MAGMVSVAIHLALLAMLVPAATGGKKGDKPADKSSGSVRIKLIDKPQPKKSKSVVKLPKKKDSVPQKTAVVIPVQDYQEHSCERWYGGIGIQQTNTTGCVISFVPKGYPADRAGIQVGDLMMIDEFGVCPGRGEIGTPITVTWMHGGKVFVKTLIREKICTDSGEIKK